MLKKLKKKLVLAIFISQLTLGIFVPAFQNSSFSKYFQPALVKAADTTRFEVTKYLTAPGQQQSYLKNSNPIASFIIQIINFMVLTIGSLCFLSIVIGGFTLLVSNGYENLVNKGKEIIKFAVIGLVIILFAYLIVAFVQSLFYELPGK